MSTPEITPVDRTLRGARYLTPASRRDNSLTVEANPKSCFVLVYSHIRLIVLATEETTVTQQISHIPIKCQSRSYGYIEVRRSTGHSMVLTCYSDQQRSKSPQNSCQVRPSQNIGNLSASRQCLWVRTTVSTFWSAVSIAESEL